jgi:CPA2 family monovalent cation:H+ antiporter-2
VLELNGATVRQALERGVNIHYADVSAHEPLEAAGVAHANAVVAVLSDPVASERAVKAVRALSPEVPIIARTRYRREAERLASAGATLAVAEELEASLEVMAQLLARLNIAGNIIEPLLDVFRRELVSLRPLHAPKAANDSLTEAIRRTPVATHRIESDQWSEGRSIAEINLRASTNASVIAIQRGERYITTLSPDERLGAGDVLYLVGDESDVLLARKLLAAGP